MKPILVISMMSVCIVFQSATAQTTWQKHPDNPVLRFWTGDVDDPNGYKYALDPAVLVDRSNLYHMWFTSCAFGYGTSFSVSEAFSLDMVRWFTYFKNPVLVHGPAGTWDERGVRPMSVVRDSTGYKMYYLGFTNASHNAIGLATSPDGMTWTKCPTNPVLDAGPRGAWDSVQASLACVCFDGSTYSLYYTGTNGSRVVIGLATSHDGIVWTRYPGNPVLDAGLAGSWDDHAAQAPAVVKAGGLFHMFYNGNNISPDVNAFHIGYAFSHDGIHWTKCSGNPVLSMGNPSEWDGQSLGTMAVLYRDRKFHLWYSGLGMQPGYPLSWQTGYASSDSTFVDSVQQADAPADYLLSQCYPNPFNPVTTIIYELPTQGHVTLKVFDVLGREVTTLVDRVEGPGNKSVQFDASKYASGAYYYRLTAGAFVQTKKLLLLR